MLAGLTHPWGRAEQRGNRCYHLFSPLQRCTDSVRQIGTSWNQRSDNVHSHKLDTSQNKARLCSSTDPDHRYWNVRVQVILGVAALLTFSDWANNDTTRFCSCFSRSVRQWTPSRCTYRCSFPQKRSCQGDPHTGRMGSSSRYHKSHWLPGNSS